MSCGSQKLAFAGDLCSAAYFFHKTGRRWSCLVDLIVGQAGLAADLTGWSKRSKLYGLLGNALLAANFKLFVSFCFSLLVAQHRQVVLLPSSPLLAASAGSMEQNAGEPQSARNPCRAVICGLLCALVIGVAVLAPKLITWSISKAYSDCASGHLERSDRLQVFQLQKYLRRINSTLMRFPVEAD